MTVKGVIRKYLSDNIKFVISLILISIFTIGLKLIGPIAINRIIKLSIDDFVNNKEKIFIWTSIMGVATVFSFIFDTIRQSRMIKFGSDITSNLRLNCYQTIMKSELYEINKNSDDEISDIIIKSCQTIGDDYLSGRIAKLIYLATFIITMQILMFAFNPIFGLVTLITLPIIYGITRTFNKMSIKRNSIYLSKKANHEYVVKDHFNQLRTIKTRNGIEKETADYNKVLKDNKKAYSKNIYIKNIDNEVNINFFIGLTWFSFLLFGFLSVTNNATEVNNIISTIVASIALSPKIFSSYKELLDEYFINLNIDKEIEKVNTILNSKDERRSENIPSLEEIHSLRLNNVTFDYAVYGISGKVNLDKIDFEVKKGERLGIIGLPGSGKSTIADLITKVIRPRQGNVLINNCDINKLNTNYLRDIVTYVPQKYELMDSSIEENIIYPLTLDEYKYNDALNKCELKDKIFSLSDRDETNARKANFSASDIQKVALANAFYKDSPILILDEATSKLDITTENDIMSEIYKLKNKITIIISNRINILSKCDKILILSSGKVVEYGRVEELLQNKKSSFAKMMQETQTRRVI